MEELAYEYFRKIDALGGMVEAVKQGFPRREIADAAFALQMEIDSKDRIVIGINEQVERDEEPLETLYVDPALEPQQIERLRSCRRGGPGARPPGSRVRAALQAPAVGPRDHLTREWATVAEPAGVG